MSVPTTSVRADERRWGLLKPEVLGARFLATEPDPSSSESIVALLFASFFFHVAFACPTSPHQTLSASAHPPPRDGPNQRPCR